MKADSIRTESGLGSDGLARVARLSGSGAVDGDGAELVLHAFRQVGDRGLAFGAVRLTSLLPQIAMGEEIVTFPS